MPGENLTRLEARQRAETVHTRTYEIDLDLTTGPDLFRAVTTITFGGTPGASTFVDLIAERVISISLNGADVDPATAFVDSRIELSNLAADNTLTVVSDQRYMNSGEGLHRFVDPADGEVYLYSQFEVPDSRRVFPVFEQPDLKATFQFTITAPARWKVVSIQPTPEPVATDRTVVVTEARGAEPVATWRFSPTPIMSSYITALIAGPYHEVRSELTNNDGRTIPLGVFCRESLKDYLDADYIFDITRQGFDFFSKEFNYPYAFEKYDQLFVAEFNAGAMENIGAVTFTEAYVFRSKVTDAMRERRVVTILHELAHMWFGDLVTMRWWNDLWLNESFAEYMSTLATAEATEWTDCWATFVASEKTWAYRQDQLPSTHPIVAEIRDLEDVLVNFDGITYAKGASVLKQLVAWVGRKPFMRGVHEYFVKHAYGNTELRDLMSELEKTSGRDLTDWSAKWLETAGVNTLTPEFTVNDDGTFASFAVRQTATSDYPTLRPHRIAIGLYSLAGDTLSRHTRVEVDIDGPSTEISELIGLARPDLILLNDDDLSYAKIRFDSASLHTVTEHLGRIDNSVARGLVWGALWDATRDAEIPASLYVDIVLAHIQHETNSTAMRGLLSQLALAGSSYVAPERREATLQNIAEHLWRLAIDAEHGSDTQFQFIKSFAALARTADQVDSIEQLLEERIDLEGLDIDTDLGWELLIALAANGRVAAADIDAALENDQTATGQQSAAHARAAIPTPAAKNATWQTIVETEGASNLIIRASALGFTRVSDLTLLEPFVPRFFEQLLPVWESRSYAIAEEIIDGFFPDALANEALRDATQTWLSANTDAPPALRRLVIEHLAGVERALAAQRFDADYEPGSGRTAKHG